MKLSEGYGILILQRREDVELRGGKMWATVAGFGESADAHHLTQPHPQGLGAARAMREAIGSAGLQAEDIGLAVAHATGTPDNDTGEHAALAEVFGARLGQVPVVAFKSHLGHTLGAAGAVELILAAKAMRDGVVPPCANLRADEVEYADMAVVTGAPREAKIGATLNTSLGFGGANTSVVLKAVEAVAGRVEIVTPGSAEDEVVITGVGAVVPGAIGNAAVAERMAGRERVDLANLQTVPEEQVVEMLNARRVRRMSDYVKLLLAATTIAVGDAKATGLDSAEEPWPAMLGTMHGSTAYSEVYYRQVVNGGNCGGEPDAVCGGGAQCGERTCEFDAGLEGGLPDADWFADVWVGCAWCWRRRGIREGRWQRAIVGAGEEFTPLIEQAWGQCGMCARDSRSLPFAGEEGFVPSAGAAVLVVESRRCAEKRGAVIRGRVEALAMSVRRRAESVAEALQMIGLPGAVLASANGSRIDGIERVGLRVCVS